MTPWGFISPHYSSAALGQRGLGKDLRLDKKKDYLVVWAGFISWRSQARAWVQ
jgi:hypothetical protein